MDEARPAFIPRRATLLGPIVLAVAALQLAVAAPPDAAKAAARKAQSLYAQEKYAEALVEFNKALAGGVRDGRLLYQAAFCQQTTGKPDALVRQTMNEAIGALRQRLQAQPAKAELADYYYMVAASTTVGDTATARRTAQEALNRYRGGQFGQEENFSSEDLFRLGRMATDAGDRALQISFFSHAAARLGAEEHPNTRYLARSLMEVARADLEANHLAEGRKALEQVLSLQPDQPQPAARLLYARILYRQGDYKEAANQWHLLRTEDPARSTEAIYAEFIMRTLTQKDLLLDPSHPLEDVSSLSRADLEKKLREISAQMTAIAKELPPEAAARGFLPRKKKQASAKRIQMKTLRDLKFRLARVAGAYIDQGHPIRDYAFTNGLQSALRTWKLPMMRFLDASTAASPTAAGSAEDGERKRVIQTRKKARRERRAARQKTSGDGER